MISGRPDGSGLGLAITQNIIAQHHGSIQVNTKPGHTCFSIYLPFTQEVPHGEPKVAFSSLQGEPEPLQASSTQRDT